MGAFRKTALLIYLVLVKRAKKNLPGQLQQQTWETTNY